MKPNVFEYSESQEYLNAILLYQKERNSNYSLRAWARQLGYKTPSYISEVLLGKRKAGLDLVKRLSSSQNLNNNETRFLELMVLNNNSKSAMEKQLYHDLLKQLHPQNDYQDLNLEMFRLISDWYHLALFEMVALPSFKEDYPRLAKQLGSEINAQVVSMAIDRLLRLKLLKRDQNGKLVKASKQIKVGDKGFNEAIRNHHKQMLNKAVKAIDEQDVNDRHISGTTIPIRQQDLPKAIKIIQKFHDELHHALKTDKPNSIYHINTQLFYIIKASEEETREGFFSNNQS